MIQEALASFYREMDAVFPRYAPAKTDEERQRLWVESGQDYDRVTRNFMNLARTRMLPGVQTLLADIERILEHDSERVRARASPVLGRCQTLAAALVNPLMYEELASQLTRLSGLLPQRWMRFGVPEVLTVAGFFMAPFYAVLALVEPQIGLTDAMVFGALGTVLYFGITGTLVWWIRAHSV